jgi:hypothetical protein
VASRDEVLAAAKELAAGSSDSTFTIEEIVDHLRRRGSSYRYKPPTIRTHVTSRMCANALGHHAVTYRDLVLIGDGRYRVNSGR